MTADPPTRVDSVVIGGGLLGAALAWTLARAGASVALLEKDQLNQHASGQNAGSLHYQLEYRMVERGLGEARRAAEAMPLHLQAAELWAGLEKEIGESVGFKQSGGLMLAETAEQAATLEQKAQLERSWGLDVEMLDGDRLRKLAPYLGPSVVAAAYCPLEGKADARIAAPALARAAIRLGAHMSTRTRVTAIERTGAQFTVTAELRGSRAAPTTVSVRSDTVMLAAGVWTDDLARMLGTELPTIPLALTMSVTAKTAPFLPHLVQHAGARLSLKQTLDGTVLIGGGWPARLALDAQGRALLNERPHLVASSLAGNARTAMAAAPAVGRLPVLRSWVGTTTVAPDQLPHVGAVPGHPGVFVATGGSAFTLGPSFARVLTDLAAGRAPDIDLTPYDPTRFGGLR